MRLVKFVGPKNSYFIQSKYYRVLHKNGFKYLRNERGGKLNIKHLPTSLFEVIER